MEIRKATAKDDLYKIAKLIYESDRFIYPYWLKSDKNLSPIVDIIKTKNTAYYYKNITVVVSNNNVIAMAISFDNKTNLTSSYSNIADNFRDRYTIKNYFLPLKNHVQKDYLYISNICVDKHYRRQKYGEKLLTYLCENTNHKKIALTVVAKNTPALNLYEKSGFVITEKLPGFNGPLKPKPLIYDMEKIKSI
jgi:predicted GNAT family N-acyltransferase